MDVTTPIAWTLLHFLWQGALVAAGAAIALHVLRRGPATSRYNVSVVALALMTALPLVTLVQLQGRAKIRTASPEAPRADAAGKSARLGPSMAFGALRDAGPSEVTLRSPAAGDAGTSVAERVSVLGDVAAPYLVRAWLLGVLVLSLRLVFGWLGVVRLTRVGVRTPAEAIRARFEEMSRRIRVSRPVRLIESTLVATPAAVGFLRPALLWPVALHSGLTVSQVDLLLAHELAHLKRHDYLVNVLQTLIETALFYHPGVWWLSKRIRHERELCCDDMALEVAGDPREYAETLLTLETWRQNVPALAAASTGGDLMTRVRRLVATDAGHGASRPRWAALPIALAALGGVLGLAPEAPARTSVEQEGLAPRMLPAAKTPTGPAKPSGVFRFEGSGRLETRIRWSEAQAASRGLGRYWIGYGVSADPAAPLIYIDRVVPISLNKGTLLSGHMKFRGADSLKAPGVPLESVVGPGDLSRTVVFIGLVGGAPGVIERVHAASAGLPVHLDGRPLFWLDQAEDAESLAWIQQAVRQASSEDLVRDLVAVAGAHSDHRLVFETLKGWVESDAGDSIRASAVEELGAVPSKDVVTFLERTARSDRSRSVRVEAAEALGEHSDPLATLSLGALARTAPDPEVAREAAESLGEQASPDALVELGSLIWSDAALEVRREAVESLGEIGTPRGVQEIARVAKTHPVKAIRDEAVEALEDLDDPQSSSVLKDLAAHHRESEVRRRSIEALFERGELKDGLGAVDRLMNSNDDRSAETAVELLGNLESEVAIERLGEIARSDVRPEIRRRAAEALGGAAPADKALKVLTALVERHPRVEVQRQAVESIGGFDGQEIGRELERIARTHPSENIRVAAIEALDHERHGDVLAIVGGLARDLSPGRARETAVEMLFEQPDVTDWAAGSFAKDSVPIQLALLNHMGDAGSSAIPLVIAILRGATDSEVRRKALEILAESKDPRAKEELARIIEK